MIYELDKNSSYFRNLHVGTLVDGSFNPLHHGHIRYFDEARSIGLPVSCLIAPDDYTLTKHRVLISAPDRALVISSLKQIENVFFGNINTELALTILRPKIFFKGADWRGKLPATILAVCNQIKCDIKFGSDPVESSSNLLRKFVNE